MARAFGRASRKWQVVVILAGVAIMAALLGPVSNASAPGPAGVQGAASKTGHVGAARMVQAGALTKPFVPTKVQRQARQRAMAGLAKHKAPSMGKHTTAADVTVNGGPQSKPERHPGTGRLQRSQDSLINSTCGGCGQSTVNEPSVANSGKSVVETSNWNIAYSTNGGDKTPSPG